MRTLLTIAAGLSLLAISSVHADDDEAKGPAAGEPARFETSASARINGRNLAYRVVASETFLLDERDEPVASIFSTAYFLDGARDPSARPVVFVFNGGPGSASLWLHMGAFGPRRVAVPSDARDDGAPPYAVEDNAHSILDVADLVFIDPIGTGFSRVLGDEEASDYYGVQADARAIGRFIRRWLTENERWASPKYLAGESYGTTRAAALVNELTGGWTDVAFNGVILVSAILDFQTARFAPGNDAPHIAFLPSMAATGWYHGLVDQAPWDGDIEAFLDDVRTFAVREYGPALMMGALLEEGERAQIVEALTGYTGLSARYVEQANLRIDAFRFMRELRRSDGLVVGRLDSRYTGVEPDDTGATFEADPAGYGIDAAYTAAVNDYFTRELGVDIVRDYEVLSGRVFGQWEWDMEDGPNWPAYVNVAPWLGRGMRQNADMRVLLASGYYDLATPFFGAELSLTRHGVPFDRVVRTYYEAGHMMYVHEPSLEALGGDLRAFIRGE